MAIVSALMARLPWSGRDPTGNQIVDYQGGDAWNPAEVAVVGEEKACTGLERGGDLERIGSAEVISCSDAGRFFGDIL